MMEVMNMKRVAVKFNQPDQIIDFVRIMNRYEDLMEEISRYAA